MVHFCHHTKANTVHPVNYMMQLTLLIACTIGRTATTTVGSFVHYMFLMSTVSASNAFLKECITGFSIPLPLEICSHTLARNLIDFILFYTEILPFGIFLYNCTNVIGLSFPKS